MLAYRLLNRKTVCMSHSDCPEMLRLVLDTYRRDYLSVLKHKNGYKKGVFNGTPEFLKRQFAAFDRKIKGIPLFNDEVKMDYLKGVELIWQEYYENQSVKQGLSKSYKKTARLANEYIAKNLLFGRD